MSQASTDSDCYSGISPMPTDSVIAQRHAMIARVLLYMYDYHFELMQLLISNVLNSHGIICQIATTYQNPEVDRGMYRGDHEYLPQVRYWYCSQSVRYLNDRAQTQ